MSTHSTTLIPGRTLSRSTHTCHACGARMSVGEPRSLDGVWPSVTLSPAQIRLLLVAAAEYRDLTASSDEDEHAVEFVDWVVGCLNQR